MKLYLIRHGETVDNKADVVQGWRDSALTELGHEQARRVGKQLVDLKPTIIFCSDLGRTQQTAAEVTKELGDVTVLTDWRLRERMMGDAEGEQHGEIDRDELRGLKSDNTIKGMESMERFTERVLHFVSDLLDFSGEHESVAIVTHNGVFNRFAFLTDESSYTFTDYPNGDVFELELKAKD